MTSALSAATTRAIAATRRSPGTRCASSGSTSRGRPGHFFFFLPRPTPSSSLTQSGRHHNSPHTQVHQALLRRSFYPNHCQSNRPASPDTTTATPAPRLPSPLPALPPPPGLRWHHRGQAQKSPGGRCPGSRPLLYAEVPCRDPGVCGGAFAATRFYAEVPLPQPAAQKCFPATPVVCGDYLPQPVCAECLSATPVYAEKCSTTPVYADALPRPVYAEVPPRPVVSGVPLPHTVVCRGAFPTTPGMQKLLATTGSLQRIPYRDPGVCRGAFAATPRVCGGAFAATPL